MLTIDHVSKEIEKKKEKKDPVPLAAHLCHAKRRSTLQPRNAKKIVTK